MDIENIILISFGYFDQEIIESISGEVKNEFSVPVRNRQGYLDLSEFYDPARRQYNGTSLLKRIESEFTAVSSKTVGLFSVDLFIPILTFIFGQAFLNGNSGVVSVYRLSNERYGMKPDTGLLNDRFRKEIIHELGHMFGLIHCTEPVCVMRSSTYVEDIDMKSAHFCHQCKAKLV